MERLINAWTEFQYLFGKPVETKFVDICWVFGANQRHFESVYKSSQTKRIKSNISWLWIKVNFQSFVLNSTEEMANRFLLNTFDSRSTFNSVRYLTPEHKKMSFTAQPKTVKYTEEIHPSTSGKQVAQKSEQFVAEIAVKNSRKRGWT